MFARGPLPPGYRFTETSDIGTEEAVRLWQDAEFVARVTSDDTAAEWEEAINHSIMVLGVRDRRHNLVGMGSITGDRELAWLNDLSVHPDHRHQGIGRTLIRERVAIADSIGIPRLDVCLAESNTLKPLYHQLGFRAINPNGIFLSRKP